jgi:hypothetical protein
MHHAEHRAVCSNSKSEGEQSNDGEARTADKAAEAVANILEKAFSEGVPGCGERYGWFGRHGFLLGIGVDQFSFRS